MIIFKPRVFPSPFVKPCLSSSNTIPTLNREVLSPASLLHASCWPRCHAVCGSVNQISSFNQPDPEEENYDSVSAGSMSWYHWTCTLLLSKGRQSTMQLWEQGAGTWEMVLDWLGLQNSVLSAVIQTDSWESDTSHVRWRREEAIGQESTWMCHKWRMPLITSVSHYHPPVPPTIPCAVPNTKSKLQAEIWNKDGQVLLQGVGTS